MGCRRNGPQTISTSLRGHERLTVMTDKQASDDETKTNRWLSRWAGVGAGAIVLAFMAGREMQAANPIALATIGLVLMLAIFASHHAETTDSRGEAAIATGIATLLAIGSGLLIIYVGHETDQTISANTARCRIIQDDMLTATPRRTDGPDLFQALGCQPQGDGTVAFPKRVEQRPQIPAVVEPARTNALEISREPSSRVRSTQPKTIATPIHPR